MISSSANSKSLAIRKPTKATIARISPSNIHVKIDYQRKDSKYKKLVRISKSMPVHYEGDRSSLSEGDTVFIIPMGKKVSKTKSWIILDKK